MSHDPIPENFTEQELACKKTGKLLFQRGFLPHLGAFRYHYGMPMIVTSGCRSPEHNVDIDGHPRSLHMFGNPHWGIDACAIDIARVNVDITKLFEIGLNLGWSFGIGPDFIHMDRRTQFIGLKKNIFTYY